METPIKIYDGGRYFLTTVPEGWEKVRNGRMRKGDLTFYNNKFIPTLPIDWGKSIRDYLCVIRKNNKL